MIRGSGAARRGRRQPAVARAVRRLAREQTGQTLVLLVGVLATVLVGVLVIGAVARGLGLGARDQRAADLGALGGARAMRAAYPRLFEPARIGGRPNPAHLERAAYLDLGRRAAVRTAALNGAHGVAVSFPDGGTLAPTRIRLAVHHDQLVTLGGHRHRAHTSTLAEAQLAPAVVAPGPLGSGEYRGPLAYRQGKPMRPDVAVAFDRMAAAARRDGISLVINSAFRSSAEQAALFARHPDPKWVAPPGKSLHRLGTELDLGPSSAYGWLAANARRFHFVQRYSWERWHYGYVLNAGSASVGLVRGGHGDGHSAVPSFVPAAFAPAISRAAQRWNVSAALISAQLYTESNFNPFAVSGAGARGIAQFVPGTAATYGLRDPFDAQRSIDAQAHLMHDLLRRFASVPLALAAYNAGPGPVAACGCVPPYPETTAYVARILGLMRGAGDSGTVSADFTVRLVR